jgi:hypothetical protein
VAPLKGTSNDPDVAAVDGRSSAGHGVNGVSTASGTFGVYGECATGHGVHGKSASSRGVAGFSDSFQGVYGHSDSQAGVVGESGAFHGVFGIAHNVNSAGLHGTNDSGGPGIVGAVPTGAGTGVSASSRDGAGVSASSEAGEAVHAETRSAQMAAVAAFSFDPDGTGAAVYGKKEGGSGHAGYFDGAVHVTRVLTVDMDIQLTGADLAEQFEVVGQRAAEPGSVVVLAGDDRVAVSDAPYDRRVAGVVSGAGSYRPALVLDSQAGVDRRPLALTGKVWCNVDADCGPVGLGDLLTTSPTPGHAMRAADPARAFGAVIGKALGSLASGRGLVPVLVALQ